MDDPSVCTKPKSERTVWASETTSVILIGRGSDNRRKYRDCEVVIGAATTESKVLNVCFDAFHIKDCGVLITVNQSMTSDFSPQSQSLVSPL